VKIFYYNIVMDCVLILSVIFLLTIMLVSSREMYMAHANKLYPLSPTEGIRVEPNLSNGEKAKDACETYCDKTIGPDCKGFVLYRNLGQCSMITSNVVQGVNTFVKADKITTYMKGGDGGFENVDYNLNPGGQIEYDGDLELDTAQNCQKACDDTRKCNALIFDADSKTCVLKRRSTKSGGSGILTMIRHKGKKDKKGKKAPSTEGADEYEDESEY